MIYAYLNNLNFAFTLTLGDLETTNPPLLRIIFNRKGTNETVVHDPLSLDVTPGTRFVTVSNIETNIFAGSGQYSFTVFSLENPVDPVLIETGILEVITNDPVTKKQYGEEKQRGEYKGHI